MQPLGNALLNASGRLPQKPSAANSFTSDVDVERPTHATDELTEGLEHELDRELAYVEAYKQPKWRLALFWVLGIVTGGVFWLVCLWSVPFRIKCLYSKTELLDAEYMYLELRDKRSAICKVETLQAPGLKPVRHFTFHTVRFMFSSRRGVFEAVPGTPTAFSQEMCTARRAVGAGHTPASPPTDTRQRRAVQYGDNLLAVDMPNFWLIFAHDALQPFIVFQYLSVVIWSVEAYYTYSVLVFVITMTSVITNSWSQYSERRRMAELAHYVCEVERVSAADGEPAVNTLGPNGHRMVPSSSLVPGDIIVVTAGKVPYDAILLEGECVVDETVLTGESVPVRKAAYDPELDGVNYNMDTFNHCTLFNGTVVSAVRGGRAGRPALAVVVTTGFNTAKGRLLRTIMFPRPHDLQFIKQAMYFIGVMFIMAVAFYIWDVVALVRLGVGAGLIVVKAFDMITTAVPPALACCLAIATTISVMRLRKKEVYVLDTERVALAGLLDAICFDKTGTLTETGLELGGVVPIRDGRFASHITKTSSLSDEIQELFAACHGLTQLGDTCVGDPLDQRLFEASGYEMRFEEEPPAAIKHPNGSSSSAGATGPFLMLRRQAMNLPLSRPAMSGTLPYRPSSLINDVGSPPSTHALLHDNHHRNHSSIPMLSDAQHEEGLAVPQSIGHGDGVLATLQRKGPSPKHGPHGLLPIDLNHLTRHPSHEVPVESAAEHQHPSHIDPHHKPIHVAGERFHPEDAIIVLRRFDFSSERLRSSAVVLQPDGRVLVFTKGSPEKLLTLMDPDSVPADFAATLQAYTKQGLRVIAIASREVTGISHPSEVLALTQDQLEAGTKLLGLVLMVNRLKPESAPAIQHLHRACIRTAMVTGDHVRTAVTVARQCAIMSSIMPALVIDVGKGSLYEAEFVFESLLPDTRRSSTENARRQSMQLSVNPPALETSPSTVNPSNLGYMADGPHGNGTSNQQSHNGGLQAVSELHNAGSHPLETVSNSTDGAAEPQHMSMAAAFRVAATGQFQVAVTGRAWQKANADPEKWGELLQIILQRGTVFARMSPDDKRSLIEQLGFGEVDSAGRVRPGCGYYTGYCGDGANDLGALKGALVGVSLCDAEASIAAPMTSRVPHVGIMCTVVAEGRCSMVTSLIIFKYTMVYAYIQVLSLALLYNLGLTVGNYQYLLQDLFHTTLLASCMALTGPAKQLSKERPLARVLSGGVILPVLGQMIVDTIVQLMALSYLHRQDFYTPFDAGSRPEDEIINIPISEQRIENSVLFIVSTWQLIINALVFNVGRPFRRGMWTNPYLGLSLLGLFIFNVYVLWAPVDWFKRHVAAVVDMPDKFKLYLSALIIFNLALAYVVDWLSKLVYAHGREYLKKRGAGPSTSRLTAGALGLGPRAPPTIELQTAVSGATAGLLPGNIPRSASSAAV